MVTVLLPGFLTPRMVIHICSASIITMAPLAPSSCISASAICAPICSCICNLLAYTSTVRAILLSPTTFPSGIIKELNSYIHPKSIKKIKIDGKPVEHEVVRSINVYFITFMILFSVSVLAISFEGKDLITNFTAVAATINNIGPGLEMVGPTQNFGMFSDFSKYVLMFDMLAGRLELFPLLILFHPAIWRDLFTSRFHAKK